MSDTETESQASSPRGIPISPSTEYLISSSLDAGYPVDLNSVLAATNLIQASSEDLETDLYDASLQVVAFLDASGDHLSSHGPYRDLLGKIISPTFLSVLFVQRRTLQALAHRSRQASSSHVVLTCVDNLIARLEATILSLGKQENSSPDIGGSKHIFVEKEEERLRAATRLPGTWTSLPQFLVSSQISPICRRLALTLLYGAYVIAPGISPPLKGSPIEKPPHDLHSSLLTYMSLRMHDQCGNMLDDEDGPLRYATTMETSEYAMCLNLISMAETSNDENSPQISNSYKPHALSNVIALVNTVLQPSRGSFEIYSPNGTPLLVQLSGSQNILLSWGNFVPWSWSLLSGFHESRHLSTFTCLTASWLQHIACLPSKASDVDLPEGAVDWDADVEETLALQFLNAPDNAGLAILCVLDAFVPTSSDNNPQTSPDSESFKEVLYMSFWACQQLTGAMNHQEPQPFFTQACRFLSQWLFSDILRDPPRDENAAEMHIAIMIYLVTVGSNVIRLALDPLVEDTAMTDLRNVPASLVRLLSQPTEPPAFSFPQDHLTGLRLELMALIAHAVPDLARALSSSSVPHLAVEWASRVNASDGLASSAAVENVLLFVFVLKSQAQIAPETSGMVSCDTELVRSMIMDQGPTNLALLSSVARYCTLDSVDHVLKALHDVEMWDYLRDGLLLILGGHHVEEGDKALAEAVGPLVCVALGRLLGKMVIASRVFVLNSPWTTSLLAELKVLAPLDKTDDEDVGFRLRKVFVEWAAMLGSVIRAERRAIRASGNVDTPTPADFTFPTIKFTYIRLSPSNPLRLLALYAVP